MKGKLSLLIIFIVGFYCLSFHLYGWITAQRVAFTPENSKECSLTIDHGGNVYAVWADFSPGNYEIYFKRNFDQSTNAAVRLTWTSWPSNLPYITHSSLWNLHLVWQESVYSNAEIYYKNSTDAGLTWSAVKRLTWTPGGSMNPVIAADSSENLHLIWRENRDGKMQLHYKKSTDGGASWSKVKRLMWTNGSAYFPQITVDTVDNIHIVWEDDSSGFSDIYYKKSTDGGSTWSISKRITWNLNDSKIPDIVVDYSGNIHIVYQQFWSPSFIAYKKSEDGGVNWGPIVRLNWAHSGYWPVIDVDSKDGIHVVWQESMLVGNDEIIYKISPNNGADWLARVRLTWTDTDSQFAAMQVGNSDIVWVLWEDGPFGDKDIFWKNSK